MDVIITFKYDRINDGTSNVLKSLLNFKFEVVKYVNVIFDGNGGNVSNTSKQVIVNSPYGELPVPTREGYTFSGWSFEKVSKEIIIENNIVNIDTEHTLYAQWKASTQYTITYYANASDSFFNGWTKQITELKTHDTPCVISTPTELNINRGDKWIWTEWNTEPDGSGVTHLGTNIIDSYENYHTQELILAKEGATVTHRHENMQWSTESSGTYNVFLDFVPNIEKMYWFWETTDIVDGNEMNLSI